VLIVAVAALVIGSVSTGTASESAPADRPAGSSAWGSASSVATERTPSMSRDLARLTDAQGRAFSPSASPPQVGTQMAGAVASFQGAASSDNPANAASERPDGALAAGPSHLMQAVNQSVLVLSKTGTVLVEAPVANIFGIPATSTPTAPRVLYDHFTGQWFFLTTSQAPDKTASRLHVAYSVSSDPVGAYCKYTFDMTVDNGVPQPIHAEFPGLGVNSDGFYVSVTRVQNATSKVYDVRVDQMTRAMFAGCVNNASSTNSTVKDVAFPDGQPVRALQPAVTFGTAAEYFVGSEASGGSAIAVYSWPLGGTGLVLQGFTAVPAYAAQPSAAQQGSVVRLDVLDDRIPSAAIWRGGSLWFAHGAASPGGTPGVVWYQLDPASGTLRNRQLVWFQTGGYFEPAIMVDAAGNMALSMGASGTSMYPGAAVLTRGASDPPAVIGSVVVYADGVGPHDPAIPGGLARWGDYHGIALDPDGQGIWVEGEYSPSSAAGWATAIAHISAAPAPGTETGHYAVTAVPASPAAGATVTLSAQLLSASGAPLATAGRTVTWSAAPPGAFSAGTSTTNAAGVASVGFTTSTAPASYSITAQDNLGATGTSGPIVTRSLPTMSVYLPNVTKTLGGPNGFQTPFIVQNVGVTSTDLQISFYRFADGSLVTQRSVLALSPGASFADVPNNDLDLPNDSQFSVVITSFGAPVVAVVNEHNGSIEADAYAGASSGATTVFLPNVVRRFFGFHSPIIIQNVGSAPTTATATFVSFDGTAPRWVAGRTIAPGQSQFIEPNIEPGLVDGKQYSVTITSAQPVSVVLNTHNDDPGAAQPVFYSANGISGGATAVYGAYAVKNANGARFATIVLQNVGAGPVTPAIAFTPFAGGPATTFSGPAVAAGASWAIDPRYANGNIAQPFCGVTGVAGCLADGEYSFVASAGGAIAAVVNVFGPGSAMGYTATPTPATKYFLPNVLASYGGWTTPIILQSIGASSATLTWTPFTGGASIAQPIVLAAGQTLRIDPNLVVPQGKQYAVTVAANGTLAAIVMELNVSGGDNAMIYSGFPAP
jgi:hypothetical protein